MSDIPPPPPPPPPPYGSVPPPPPAGYSYAPGPSQGLPPGVSISSAGKRFGGMWLSLLLIIVTLGIGYLIWAIIAWTRSTTPAKQVLKMKVLDAKTLQPASTGKMWMRQVVWALAFGIADSIVAEALDLPPGTSLLVFLMLLVDLFLVTTTDRRQRVLDRLAGTIVVDDPNDAWGVQRR